MMYYRKYCPIDLVNGEGLHCSLIVSGCRSLCCEDAAASPHIFSTIENRFNKEIEERIMHDLQDEQIKRRGFSIAGNDPLHPQNLNALYMLLTRVRFYCPTKEIWIWTSYNAQSLTFEQIEVAKLVNVIIDNKSPFIFHDPYCLWRTNNKVQHYTPYP